MDNGKYLKEMGRKIRETRIAQKMTLVTLCKLTGFHMSVMSPLERGMRNTHILTLKKIAEVLKKDVKDFL